MMFPKLTPFVACLALTACLPVEGGEAPSLARLDTSHDDALDLVDQAAILADAVEQQAGPAPDLASAPEAFFLHIDGSKVSDVVSDQGTARGAFPTYEAVLTATAAVVVADLAAASVIAPTSLVIAFAADGELTEHSPWHWSATNTAGDGTVVTLDVAYVGVGWLAELHAGDGSPSDPVVLDGFLGLQSAVGWWNFHDNGAIVGVVEWTVDGQGNGQAAIGAVGPSPDAGDILAFGSVAGGDKAVSFYDAGADYLNYVVVHPDESGEVALIDRNGGLPMCWDSTFVDVPCP